MINDQTNLPQIISKFQNTLFQLYQQRLCYSISLILYGLSDQSNSKSWFSFWLLTIFIFMLLSLLISRFCTSKCTDCVCFSASFLSWWKHSTEHHGSWLWLQVGLKPSQHNPETRFQPNFWPEKHRRFAESVQQSSSWYTVQERILEKPGRSVSKSRSSLDIRSKMVCVRSFLMMAAQ